MMPLKPFSGFSLGAIILFLIGLSIYVIGDLFID